RNQLSRRVRRQPAGPVLEQLLDLLVADVVVLGRVERRDQHVEVAQQVAQPCLGAQLDGKVAARAPLRETLVERLRPGGNGVAQRLEHTAQETLAAEAW